MLRRKKTARRYKQEKQLELPDEETSNPSVLVEAQEEQSLVWEVLNALTPTFREILVMKYIQDKRYDEISELLSIPRGTVMSRLYHARKAFRDRYIEAREREGSNRKEVV